MRQIASAITTVQKTVASGTGTRLGELGSETPEGLRLAEWLAARQPKDVDQAAVSQASRRGVSLEVLCDYRFPKDERGNSLPFVTIVKGCSVGGDDAARSLVAEDLRKLSVAAPSREIEAWLAELSVITARREADEFTETLRLEAYASRLRRYPADVAREAVLGRSWKFWPSWAELQQVCDQLHAPRKAMIAAIDAPRQQRNEDDRQRVSSERANEIIREVFGERETQ